MNSQEVILVFNFIENFYAKIENVKYLFEKNDFIFYNVPLVEKTLNLLMEFTKDKISNKFLHNQE